MRTFLSLADAIFSPQPIEELGKNVMEDPIRRIRAFFGRTI